MIVQLCGLSGAGKTTLAKAVEQKLALEHFSVEVLDGDEYRKTLCSELGFSKEHRFENLRRIAFVARQLSKHGIIAIICAINPYEQIRQEIKKNYPNVKTVFIDCPLDTLKIRDTKGLYKKAFLPEGHPEKLNNLTGVNDPFEVPIDPDLHINTDEQTPEECASKIVQLIKNSFVFPVKNLPLKFLHNNSSSQRMNRH